MEERERPGRVVPLHEFRGRAGLSPIGYAAAERSLAESSMPFKITEHYLRLIERQSDPAVRQQLMNIVIPPAGDKPLTGRFDPYGNTDVRQEGTTFLQHKYRPTLLVHIIDECVANCQFCYKTREIREERASRDSGLQEKLSAAARYLHAHPEIDNVLLSGGDPAVFPSSRLQEIIRGLAEPDNVRVVRFATKGLAYLPQRFQDEALLECFRDIRSRGKRVNVITQYNHPAEIEEESIKSLRALQGAGVQVYGQPVILRGVNDDADTLVQLQNRFLENNIQSYYLVTFMPVKGVTQYALPLEKAFSLVAESKGRLNGLAKKGMLIAPHNWGKLEICGFLPSAARPEQAVMKWHEVVMPPYLPAGLQGTRPEDVMILGFAPGQIYCIDDLFRYNGLPNVRMDEDNKRTR
ncbi:MAG TPA: lysine 2,3-aminomutase [Candidatus Nanoarchaeia archaeon]|nr:lysine 2,3-aminomutase [Candidatus Nanoarchaeia archaeon]